MGAALGETLNAYAYLLIAFAAYLVLVLAGKRAGIWRRLGVSLLGPLIMWRTTKGNRAFENTARRQRLWRAYGTVCIAITLLAACALTGILVWATASAATGRGFPDIGSYSGPSAGTIVVLLYVVVGTAVAVLAHEFMHGVLSVVGRVKLDAVGLLLFLIPIGAFVEPNQKQLDAAPKSSRLRLFAVGPGTNMVLAVVFMLLLVLVFSPSAKPVADGAVVTGVAPNSPGDITGLASWNEITEVGGRSVPTAADFRNVTFDNPGDLTSVVVLRDGRSTMMALPGGLAVMSVPDGPALNARIEPGMIIYSLDNTVIHNSGELTSTIENATRDAPVRITVLRFSKDVTSGATWFAPDPTIRMVNLTSKWIYYYTHYPWLNKEQYRNQSFLGVSVSPFGLMVDDPAHLIQTVANPFAGARSIDEFWGASLKFVALPFLGSSPVTSPVSDLYSPSGSLSFLPADMYWVIVNLLYWTFWINLMLGLSNALPIIPLDGALVIRDLLRGLVQRIGARLTGFDLTIGKKPIPERRADTIMLVVAGLISAMMLYLLVWQLLMPL